MLLYYGFPSNIFNPVLLNLQRRKAQIQRVNYTLFCMPDVYTLIFRGSRHNKQAIKFPLLDIFSTGKHGWSSHRGSSTYQRWPEMKSSEMSEL